MDVNKKWRLILGPDSDPESLEELDSDIKNIDSSLSLLYDKTENNLLRRSRVKLNEWLGDIRNLFPRDKTIFLQKEAIEKFKINELLFEEETFSNLTPDLELIKTILNLKDQIPDERLEDVKSLVKEFAADIERKIAWNIQNSVYSNLSKSDPTYYPYRRFIDWKKTIKRNLKYYQPDLDAIVIQRLYGHNIKSSGLPEVFLVVDSSASMSDSVIYSSIIASILAHIRTIETSLIIFDNGFVDLTDQLDDIIKLLFNIQLGGGTDIKKALRFTQTKIKNPDQSYIFLISDLYDNYNDATLFDLIRHMKDDRITIHCMLSMDQKGKLSFNKPLVNRLTDYEIPCYAASPDTFGEALGKAISGNY